MADPAGPRRVPGASLEATPETVRGDGRPPTRLTLLYIVGHHRSGGTALGAVLASEPTIFFAGELYRFPDPIWSSGDGGRGCSCGAPVLACPFWNEVRRAAEARDLLGALSRGQRRFERWAALPRLLMRPGAGRRERLTHVRAMAEFAGIIARTSGAQVLVEYGPSAARARIVRELSAFGVNVRYLHLVRDGRGFLASELGTLSDPEAPGDWVRNPIIVLARWIAMNLAAIVLCGGDRSRYRRVRYEDLLADPRTTLTRIGELLGTDLSAVLARVEAGDRIPMRHIAAGNRARLKREIVLDRTPTRLPRLPRATRLLFWASAGWLAGPLGYRPGRAARPPGTQGWTGRLVRRLPRIVHRLAGLDRHRSSVDPASGGPSASAGVGKP
ncbi:MAG TPA: hypothetical protein VGV64_05685 [Thermoplasmata archaeon]|nr:hypothetical protein [Thermoplasmata archaeon]